MSSMTSPGQLVLVVDGNAGLSTTWHTLRTEYIDKIVRAFFGVDINGQKVNAAPGEMSLLLFYNCDLFSDGEMRCSGWTSELNTFMSWLDSLALSGGGVVTDSPIAEALAEAAIMCSPATSAQGAPLRPKHIILVSNSTPQLFAKPLPCLPVTPSLPAKSGALEPEPGGYWMGDASSVVQKFPQLAMTLSVIAPRQLQQLKALYSHGRKMPGAPDQQAEFPKGSSQHMILISDSFPEARAALQQVPKASPSPSPEPLPASVPPPANPLPPANQLPAGPALVSMPKMSVPAQPVLPSGQVAAAAASAALAVQRAPVPSAMPGLMPRVPNPMPPQVVAMAARPGTAPMGMQPNGYPGGQPVRGTVMGGPPGYGMVPNPGFNPNAAGSVGMVGGSIPPAVLSQQVSQQRPNGGVLPQPATAPPPSAAAPNMPSASGPPGAAPGRVPPYVKCWQGALIGQRSGQPIRICDMEGFRQTNASETLAAQWPPELHIGRIMPSNIMTDKETRAKADLMVFRPLPSMDNQANNQSPFLMQMAQKKLCVIVKLPSQILLLTCGNDRRLIGMLLPQGAINISSSSQSSQPPQAQQSPADISTQLGFMRS